MSWRELRIAAVTEEGHFSHQIWRLATLKTHHLHCSSLFVIMKYRTFVKNNSKNTFPRFARGCLLLLGGGSAQGEADHQRDHVPRGDLCQLSLS